MFEKKNLKQFQDRFREHFGKKSNKISEKNPTKFQKKKWQKILILNPLLKIFNFL